MAQRHRHFNPPAPESSLRARAPPADPASLVRRLNRRKRHEPTEAICFAAMPPDVMLDEARKELGRPNLLDLFQLDAWLKDRVGKIRQRDFDRHGLGTASRDVAGKLIVWLAMQGFVTTRSRHWVSGRRFVVYTVARPVTPDDAPSLSLPSQ